MKTATITMRRRGEFRTIVRGDNHCGITEKSGDELVVRYNVRVECTPPRLDGRGFLFDQMTIKGVFDACQETDLSCEQLAVHLACEIIKAAEAEHPGCGICRVYLSISPSPFAATMCARVDVVPKEAS